MGSTPGPLITDLYRPALSAGRPARAGGQRGLGVGLIVTSPVGYHCHAAACRGAAGLREHLEMLPPIAWERWPSSSERALAQHSNDLQIGALWCTCVRTMPWVHYKHQ